MQTRRMIIRIKEENSNWKCDDSNSFYIGQTGKSFTRRYNEYKIHQQIMPKSNFTEHILNTNLQLLYKALKRQ